MHIACKWSNYPNNPWLASFYLYFFFQNRLAIRKLYTRETFLPEEPNSTLLSHYFGSHVRLDLLGLQMQMANFQISIQCFIISCGTSFLTTSMLLLHFYTKRSIDDDRRITKSQAKLLRYFFWSDIYGAKGSRTHP